MIRRLKEWLGVLLVFALAIVLISLRLDIQSLKKLYQPPTDLEPCGLGGFRRVGGSVISLPLEWYPEHIKEQLEKDPCIVEAVPMDLELE
jgi:hypothetical protein